MSQPTPRLSSLFKLEYPQSVGVFPTYDEAQRVVMTTVYLQELVKRGILCLMGAYLSYSHRPEDIDAYLQAADEAFCPWSAR